MLATFLHQATHAGGLRFDEAELGPFNLVVGASASGKSRWLDAWLNLSQQLHQPGQLHPGRYRVATTVGGASFEYDLMVSPGPSVSAERLAEGGTVRLERNNGTLELDGRQIPLAPRLVAVSALEGVDFLERFRRAAGVTHIHRFAEGAQEHVFQKIVTSSSEPTKFSLHHDLELLRKTAPKGFQEVVERFTDIFPCVEALDFQPYRSLNEQAPDEVREAPVLVTRECGSSHWIPGHQLSSGMKKVLLLLVQLGKLPPGSCYLLDEIENSLGPGVLEDVVELLRERRDIQVVATTHHPYAVGVISPECWLVFGRVGQHVKIRSGQDNRERYGRSRHDWYTQLTNDPFYLGES